MAEWLRPLPDGRTVKDYVAEAAALACRLDQRTAELAATQHSGRSTQHTRERRPVRMLARELRECLARAAGRLETLPPEQSVPQSVRDELDSLRRLLTALRA